MCFSCGPTHVHVVCESDPSQELPELRVKARRATAGKLAGKCVRLAWEAQLRNRLQRGEVKDATEAISKANRSERETRLASKDFMHALDHTLRHLGLGLNTFENTPEIKLPSRFEKRCAVRPKRPLDGVPADKPQKRLCLKDENSGKIRFESPRGELEPSVLWIIGDEGPKDRPVFWFLPGRGFRVLPLWDPLHRVSNDLQLAAKDTGNWSMIKDTTAVCNFNHAPFQSCGWLEVQREGVQNLLAKATTYSALFRTLFDDLCEDKRDKPADFGTEAHLGRVLAAMEFSKSVLTAGQKVQWTRWGTHHWALRKLLPDWSEKLMVCAATAVEAGHFAAPGSLPILGMSFEVSSVASAENASLVAAVALPVPVGEDGRGAAASSSDGNGASSSAAPAPQEHAAASAAAGRGAKHAGAVEKMRKENAAGIEVVVKVLADPETKARARIWNEVTHAVWKSQTSEYANMTSPEATLKYYLAYARGAYNRVFDRIAQCLSDHNSLERMGMSLSTSEYGGPGAGVNAIGEPFFKTQDALAQLTVDALVAVVKWRALSMMHYTSACPAVLVLLLSPDEGERNLMLDRLEHWWRVMTWSWQCRHVNKDVDDLFKNVPWLSWTVIIDIFVRLAEVDFSCVPASVDSMLRSGFEGFGTTLVNELAFKHMRLRADESSNNRVGPNTAWAAARHSSVFERFERNALKETPVASAPDQLPKNSFSSRGGELSVDVAEFEAITQAFGFRTFTSISKNYTVAAWASMVHIFDTNSKDMAGELWRATLLTPRSVVRNRCTERSFLVLETCRYGFLGWPMAVLVDERERFVFQMETGGNGAEWVAVLRDGEWETWLPHASSAVSEMMQNRQSIIAFYSASKALSILEMAAMHAFAFTCDSYLPRLLRDAGLWAAAVADRPQSTLEKVRV